MVGQGARALFGRFRHIRSSYFAWIVLKLAIVAVPLIAFSLLLLDELATLQRRSIIEAMHQNARAVSAAVDAQVEKYITAARVLSSSPAVLSKDFDKLRAELDTVLPSLGGAWIIIGDPSGRQVFNARAPADLPLPYRAGPAIEAQTRAFRTGTPQVAGISKGPVTGEHGTSVEFPIFKDGKPHLSLAILIDVGVLHRLLLTRDLPSTWLTAILDPSGRFLARSSDSGRLVGQLASDDWRDALAVSPDFGLAMTTTPEGVEYQTAWVRSSLTGWTTGIAVSKAALEGPLHSAMISLVTGGLAIVCVSLSAAAWGAARTSRRIRELGEAAGAMARGRPMEVRRTGIRELDALGAAIARAAHELHELAEQRNALRRRFLDAQETERLRLSHELHDETGQNLAAAKIELKRLERKIGNEEQDGLRRLRAELDEVANTVRRAIWQLRPVPAGEGVLVETLSALVSQWSERLGISANFYSPKGDFTDISDEIKLTICRVAQEALTNVAKHAANATLVTVSLNRDGTFLRLVIEDNGAGFAVAASDSAFGGTGLGLVGMRERLSLIDGELEVESAPGVGTSIFARVPLARHRSAA